MAIRSRPYYWVECDECGNDIEGAWDTVTVTLWNATESDWHIEESTHLCPYCDIKRVNAEADDE